MAHEFKNSSLLKSCDYDDKSNTLIIEFHNGGTYHYEDCHKSHFEGLKAAASAGSYFGSVIRTKFKGKKQ